MEKQIIIHNILVSYTEFKGENNKTLLFLHGWRSQKEIWNEIINKLRDLDYNVYALDLPGFGKTESPVSQWGVSDYATLVEGFVKKIGLKDVVLIGHSFGGRVSIKLASTGIAEIKKLVLVDSAAFPSSESKKKLFSVLAKIAKPLFRPAFMEGVRQKIYQQIGAEDYVATPQLQKTFVKVVNEDLTEDIKKIKIPTLIVYGEDDVDTPVSFGKVMNTLIPDSKLSILEGAGHYSFIDKPEEFVRHFTVFLSA